MERTRALSVRTLSLLCLLSAFCVALVVVRNHVSERSYYRFLDWNLFLAWLPLLFSSFAARAETRASEALWTVLWLLFFPNAPYLVTDFVHLGNSPYLPLWFDVVMLSAFSVSGLLLGFFSLRTMQLSWRKRWGAAVSRVLAFGVLALTSAAIYLGRFIRLNSWDAFIRPAHVARHLIESVSSPTTAAAMAVATLFLVAGYGAMAALVEGERQ